MSDALSWSVGALRLVPTAFGLSLAGGRLAWIGWAWLLALLPFVRPAAAFADAGVPLAILLELCVGLALALSLCAPLWAARQGAHLLELGFGGRWEQSGALRELFGMLALSLFASLGGLRTWSRALIEASAVRLDVGRTLAEVGLSAAALVGEWVRLSLTVAAPAWIAFVLLDLSLASLSRLSGGAGQAIVGFAMPLRLISIAVALPVSADRWPEWWRLSTAATLRLIRSWGV